MEVLKFYACIQTVFKRSLKATYDTKKSEYLLSSNKDIIQYTKENDREKMY